MEKINFKNPKYYFNREISWIGFNERVLEEALDKNNKLMERLKFLAITAANMDEFFMVRVSGLKQLVDSNSKWYDASGMTPKFQLNAVSKIVHEFVSRQYNTLNRSILPGLEKENVLIKKFEDLDEDQINFVHTYFKNILFPILTPMAIDKSRPFPLLNNKSINLVVKLEVKIKGKAFLYAVIQVPTVVPRILKIPSDNNTSQFIFIDNIIKHYAYNLFLEYKVIECHLFRLTRNSDLDYDEDDSDDLLDVIEKSLRSRKWGQPIRLEVEKTIDKDSRQYLKKALEVSENEIYEISGPIDLTIFMKFYGFNFPDLKDLPLLPQKVLDFEDENIFSVVSKKDVLIHHPYETFDPVISFVEEAAIDTKVLAIKQTLYRVSGNSPVVKALITAAENGKQVTVLVELKARFDEENNINWAKKLEKAGCHVVYGLVGLKTHCKLCLVVRNEEDGIKRYVHMGTGNYNDSTAKIYTDLGFFTSKESFGFDISLLFNVLTGYSTNTNWSKISAAPLTLRKDFIRNINKEINFAKDGKESYIICKMNSLVDQEIIERLYVASTFGVKITLIVRGVCCLKPGIKGVSDNINVFSIVDRFLEHSRIYLFNNDGNHKILLSSADWMPRNLDKRVEVAFPIEEEDLKNEIEEVLKIILSDTQKLRVCQPDGTYQRLDKRGKLDINSQMALYERVVKKIEVSKIKTKKQIFKPIVKGEDVK